MLLSLLTLLIQITAGPLAEPWGKDESPTQNIGPLAENVG